MWDIKGYFIRWTCKKAKKLNLNIYLIQKILKFSIQLKPEFSFLKLMNKKKNAMEVYFKI